MRGLAFVLVAVGLSCAARAPVVRPSVVTEPPGRAVPVFVLTHPPQCVDMGDVETVIPADGAPGPWSDGEARAIARLQTEALVNGGDAVMLTSADLHPGQELHGRVLRCGRL